MANIKNGITGGTGATKGPVSTKNEGSNLEENMIGIKSGFMDVAITTFKNVYKTTTDIVKKAGKTISDTTTTVIRKISQTIDILLKILTNPGKGVTFTKITPENGGVSISGSAGEISVSGDVTKNGSTETITTNNSGGISTSSTSSRSITPLSATGNAAGDKLFTGIISSLKSLVHTNKPITGGKGTVTPTNDPIIGGPGTYPIA